MSTVSFLNELLPTLSPVERRIAVYFIENTPSLTSTSILQVAQACDASKSAVVRLCKRLGYSGYKEFLTAISAELAVSNENQYDDLFPESSVGSICAIVTKNSVESLQNTLRTLDMNAMEAAVKLLSRANRVDFYGVRNSGVIAQDAEIKFRRIGYNAIAPIDSHRQTICASTLVPGDIAVLLSYSGETKDILRTLQIARRQGAATIAITRFGKNALAADADIVLQVASSESLVRSGAMTSRLVMLQALDMLFTALCSSNYARLNGILERTGSELQEKRNDVRD